LSGLHPTISELEDYVLETRIGDLVLRSPICVPKQTTVRVAAQAMDFHHIGCLVVMENDSLIGIFTERDLLNCSRTPEQLNSPLHQFMTANPETCSTDDNLAYVVRIMSAGEYRHVPVIENSRPVGLVSSRDVLELVATRIGDDDTWIDRLG